MTDWQVIEDGLKAWVVAMTATPAELVAWDMEPVGFRKYPQIDLRLFDHRARDGMSPELVYPEPSDPADALQPTVFAQRACSWSITVTTRDQRANYKAYVMLDALDLMLELPYTLECFGALGLAVLDMGRVITRSDPPSEHRDLSQAVLTLQLGYVATASAPAGTPEAAVEVIEHVEVGGTAIDVTIPIVIPPEIIPPL